MSTEISFKETLDKSNVVSFCPKGNSMRPFIKEGYTVIVKKLVTTAKKQDVILYEQNGNLILHRVKKVLPKTYVVMGDNHLFYEEIPINSAFGKMVGYYKKEKYISSLSIIYKIKVFFWSIIPLRWCLKKIYSIFKK